MDLLPAGANSPFKSSRPPSPLQKQKDGPQTQMENFLCCHSGGGKIFLHVSFPLVFETISYRGLILSLKVVPYRMKINFQVRLYPFDNVSFWKCIPFP